MRRKAYFLSQSKGPSFDWGSAEKVDNKTRKYSATRNGMFYATIYKHNGRINASDAEYSSAQYEVYVNNILVTFGQDTVTDQGDWDTVFIPLNKGDTLKFIFSGYKCFLKNALFIPYK